MNDIENLMGFSADYQFLKWLLKRCKDELPYKGEVRLFAKAMHYTKNISFFWNRDGIPPRVWLFIHKDLVIACLMGRVEEPKSLWEWKEEYVEERANRLANRKLLD